MTENALHCPECGHKVTKAGGAWSGRKRYQQFRCLRCGRVSIRPLNAEGKEIDAIPFESHAEVKK